MNSLFRFKNMGCIVKAELGRPSPLYHLTSEPVALRELEYIRRQANQDVLNFMRRAVHDPCYTTMISSTYCMAINVLAESSDNFLHYCRYLVIIKECSLCFV